MKVEKQAKLSCDPKSESVLSDQQTRGGNTRREYWESMERTRKDHGKIMERTRREHGKNMERTWREHANSTQKGHQVQTLNLPAVSVFFCTSMLQFFPSK